MAAGNRGHAVRELEEAVQLDGSNTEARELLAQLKQGRRDAAKGGKR